MNKKIIVIVVVVLVIGLIIASIFVKPKETVYKEDLLGIDYMIEGNEASPGNPLPEEKDKYSNDQ